jgi:hypothetical protein
MPMRNGGRHGSSPGPVAFRASGSNGTVTDAASTERRVVIAILLVSSQLLKPLIHEVANPGSIQPVL